MTPSKLQDFKIVMKGNDLMLKTDAKILQPTVLLFCMVRVSVSRDGHQDRSFSHFMAEKSSS